MFPLNTQFLGIRKRD